MLDEEDAIEVLERIRKVVQDRGFESFDAHAMTLIVTSGSTEDPIQSTKHALMVYLKVVSQLLRSVGAERINEAKSNIARVLDVDEISIALELRSISSLLPADMDNLVDIEGFDDADQLAAEIEQFSGAVQNFSYPDPEPNSGGPTP